MSQHQDPFLQREAEKYENPIPSREFILEHIKARQTPVSRDELFAELTLEGEEQAEALRRRLRAMERDGQLVFTRNQCYALPDKLNLVKGHVIGHREGFGFVRPDDGGDDLFLAQREMDALMHGDYVLVQPLRFDARGRREARLVRLLQSRDLSVVGRYFVEQGVSYVVPDDSRIAQDILIPQGETMGARMGQVVVIAITQRPTKRMTGIGKVTEVLGETMDPGMEIEIALRSHGIPHVWPEEVKQEIAKLTEQVPEEAKQGRKDLRDLPLVTIDGEDARDFDDAVYCQPKRSGGWRLWVAIADVSYYVRPGTGLDNEAYQRGNSVYFPEQVIPMLPEVLSNGLCSLNPQVDRLCMVAEMTVSATGKLSGFKFYEAVMNSHARLTYTKVAAILEGDEGLRERYAPLVPHLEELNRLYQAMKEARHQRGAVEFESEETRFVFNPQRKIERIVPLVRNDAHKIIEECMIMANVAAARFIEKQDAYALFRVHDKPGEEKLTGFRSFLGELGLELKGGLEPQPADYALLAEQIKDRPDAELIQTMLLRSMKQAVYQADNMGHFGLALKSYAHFTSPIRRYPDLVLHRAIKFQLARLQGNPSGKWTPTGGVHYQYDEVAPMGEHCSLTERRADDATRDVADWLKCEYMLDHVGSEFGGTIANVTGFGFFVRLDEIHIDGLVHISNLQNDYYQFDPARQMLIGETFRRRYRLGDKVKVKVMAVNLDDRKIDFELVEEALPAGAKTGKGAKNLKSRQRAKPKSGGKAEAKPADKGGRSKSRKRR
ncbi:exoribonuclease R [Zobellella denitrificans]|uniref:Ribonuclease R n=1 Tax=Zobellella denitrificans TaxID=347534 RepID=A0A291HUH6_9GAMM|nr:ribonuclease R [Zobellella denitrificans]ATG75772.1 exoribonuclease R [Zobellella denitrificans]